MDDDRLSQDNLHPQTCPINSNWGSKWRLQTLLSMTSSSKTDSEQAEAARNLAADLFFRHSAFKARDDTTNVFCSRIELDHCMKSLGDLTDNQKSINNYAQPSLQLASKLRNRSRQFRSSITEQHPSILKFIRSFEEENYPNNELGIKKFVSLFKDCQSFSQEPPEEEEIPKVSKEIDQGQSNVFNNGHAQVPPRTLAPKQQFNFRPKGEELTANGSAHYPSLSANRFNSHNDGKPLHHVPNPASNVGRGAPPTPKFGLPGIGPRPYSDHINHPQQSFQRQGLTRPNNFSDSVPKPGTYAPLNGPPSFRTAHDELIAQAASNKRPNEVSTSSYGVVKKTLGVPRPGITGSFKPPVASKPEQTPIPEAVPESETNDKLKHLDPKMVELIQNEIMDKGSPITWNDIAGLEFVKVTVKEIVVFPLLRPDIFTGLRGPPKGLLLFGPPGTGKTLIGKCIASQSKSTFFSISASSLTSKWVGEGEKMVRTLFEVARAYQPSVVFIDEIDSLLSQRSDTEHESSRRIKTEFLVQLDGATSVGDERILVVGATNRPQDLDEAARRRLVKRLYVPLPEQGAREQIIYNLLSSQSHCLTDDDVSRIGEKSEGYSGADMANLCKEAAMGPIRSLDYSKIDLIRNDDVRPISFIDFTDAFKQVKASVSDKDLQSYREWDEKFGSGK